MIDSLFIGNRDGGIVNTFLQVPSSSDPVVIIGLGGTGVDAISRLKTKLQRQIEPDNKDAVIENGDEPRYDHIKFLGIDADEDWLRYSRLTYEERLDVHNDNYEAIFNPYKLDALKNKKELQWMSIDYISQHLPPNPMGAGAYRQFGRWLTIASANNIEMRIAEVINQACTGLEGGELNVHIISGISGGMGGGSFADVCYITRKVLDDLGFNAAKVFGYFVLPDAVISKDDIIGNPVITASNEKNGIASLLEIEHLMNLEDSNEWFEQDYGSFQIRTQRQLVDMCHFVSATNMNGVTIENGYEYALNVIGDYILAFVSEKEVADSEAHISMTANLANIKAYLCGVNPAHEHGYSQNYHIIGSANAEIPTTQMATYLATQLFNKLTISRQIPSSTQIQQEFADYLKLSDSRFKELENQIAQGAEWNQVTYDLVRQYFDQIKAHMNDNALPNAMINPVETSIRQRKGLLIQKRESMEKEVDSYTYEAGASSIPGLALNKLIEIVEDPTKGPIYAYGMMNKTGADIFHYLDGRLRYYASQKHNAREQVISFEKSEQVSKRNLGNSGFFSKKRNIEEYTSTLNSKYYWQAMADLYEQMEILMENLINAL
ncbi:tubulin-like doman-containing protein, partial [Catenibacterium mitsuokai]|uniref:tubulin-like doman-containing protein n=1 Tax=Catenibacterium mitsuokai TaxID=100886 RepID=UPI003D032342